MTENNLIFYNTLDYETNNVSWVIDREPDFNIVNNFESNPSIYDAYIRNRYFEEPFTELTQRVMNGTIQFNNDDDEFIPFESPTLEPIETNVVEKFDVTEEEKTCCVCYETREFKDISQINCCHKFCGACLIQYISKKYNDSCCPLCRVKITHITFQCQKYQDEFVKIIQNS